MKLSVKTCIWVGIYFSALIFCKPAAAQVAAFSNDAVNDGSKARQAVIGNAKNPRNGFVQPGSDDVAEANEQTPELHFIFAEQLFVAEEITTVAGDMHKKNMLPAITIVASMEKLYSHKCQDRLQLLVHQLGITPLL